MVWRIPSRGSKAFVVDLMANARAAQRRKKLRIGL
jgi:hypothetical protein